MKTITYKCNLCRTEKQRDQLLCYYWASARVPQGYIVTHNTDASDVHICKECFHTIKNTIGSEIS